MLMFAKWDASVLKMLVFLLKTSFICQTNKINLILTKLIVILWILKTTWSGDNLVDQVEDNLLTYFRTKICGQEMPFPMRWNWPAALGVARSVLREALSRLKMVGMIETRTRRGMILTEPSILGGMKRVVDPRILSEHSLFDLLGFRIALELGICSDLFQNITPEDIVELKEIVRLGSLLRTMNMPLSVNLLFMLNFMR